MRRQGLALVILCLILCNGARTEEGVPESCEGLDNIGNSEHLDCVRSVDCLRTTCNVTDHFDGYGATLELFPCYRPPGLEILLISPDAITSVGEFDSSRPSRTTGVPLNDEEEDGLSAEFQITVSWPTAQTASIMSKIVTSLGDFSLLEPTNVTLPACKPDMQSTERDDSSGGGVGSPHILNLWQLIFFSVVLPSLYQLP